MNEWIIEFLGGMSEQWISSTQNIPNAGCQTHGPCSLEYGLTALKRNMSFPSGPHYRLRNVNTNEVIPMEVFA